MSAAVAVGLSPGGALANRPRHLTPQAIRQRLTEIAAPRGLETTWRRLREGGTASGWSPRQRGDGQPVYDRGGRQSPFRLEAWVLDAEGRTVAASAREYLQQVFEAVYEFRTERWREALADHPQRDALLGMRQNVFWESLSQAFARRVLGQQPVHDPLAPIAYGVCGASGSCRQDPGLSRAHAVILRTSIEARHDPLDPVDRRILVRFDRTRVTHPAIQLELDVPGGVRVGSRRIDYRPKIAGQPSGAIRIRAELPARQRRTEGPDYPDYNVLFIPARHLLLEGREYGNPAELAGAFESLFGRLMNPAEAAEVRQRVAPYLTRERYPVTGDLAGYRGYILPSIGRGLAAMGVETVTLEVDGRRLAEVSAR